MGYAQHPNTRALANRQQVGTRTLSALEKVERKLASAAKHKDLRPKTVCAWGRSFRGSQRQLLCLVRLPSTGKVVCILFDCSPHTKGLVIDSIRPRRARVLLACRTPQHKRTHDTGLAGHCKESDLRLREKLQSRPRTMPIVHSHPRLSYGILS
jgi:hypothetical protein